GAKVLQTRSVQLAMARRVPLRVLSSLKEPGEPNEGTLVCDEDAIMEQRVVSGITYTRDEARVTVLGLPHVPGRAAGLFQAVAEAGVNVDMIVQSQARAPDAANLSFTINQGDLDRSLRAIEASGDTLGYEKVISQTELAKVSVVGIGMRSHTGVAHTMFTSLAEKGISIDAISTSEIKISVLIPADYVELAVRTLHAAYGLEGA
ncbi:MAG: ACT domain-containing protein, partial [Caulobacterales bacterium]|nr:ACT domain-containing protein [Caulobacterales bacterium]